MIQKTEPNQNVQAMLETEFAKLKKTICFEDVLAVRWNPRPSCKISGELIGDMIYVYEENLPEAISTLKHEYVDCLLTQKIIQPLVTVINVFIKLKAEEIYKQKERIVADLLKLMDDIP